MNFLRSPKQKRRLAWALVIFAIAAAFGMLIVNQRSVHVHRVSGQGDGRQYVVECEIKNPTSESATIVATSTITHESLNRHQGLVVYPPVLRTVTIDGKHHTEIYLRPRLLGPNSPGKAICYDRSW